MPFDFSTPYHEQPERQGVFDELNDYVKLLGCELGRELTGEDVPMIAQRLNEEITAQLEASGFYEFLRS